MSGSQPRTSATISSSRRPGVIRAISSTIGKARETKSKPLTITARVFELPITCRKREKKLRIAVSITHLQRTKRPRGPPLSSGEKESNHEKPNSLEASLPQGSKKRLPVLPVFPGGIFVEGS